MYASISRIKEALLPVFTTNIAILRAKYNNEALLALLERLKQHESNYDDFEKCIKKEFSDESIVQAISQLISMLTADKEIHGALSTTIDAKIKIDDLKRVAISFFQEEIIQLKNIARSQPETLRPNINRKRPRSDDDARDANFQTRLGQLIAEFQAAEDERVKLGLNSQIKTLISSNSDILINFGGMKIGGLDLSNLDLQYADFSKAIYDKKRPVNFKNSRLEGAIFNFMGYKERTEIHADFEGADCSETNFSNCDLRGCNFNNVSKVNNMVLTRARLNKAVLTAMLHFLRWWKFPDNRPALSIDETAFIEEDLSNLDLSDLYLRRIYFDKNKLTRANFGNADISGCYFIKNDGLTRQMLKKCINYDRLNKLELTPAMERRSRDAEGCRSITELFKLGAVAEPEASVNLGSVSEETLRL